MLENNELISSRAQFACSPQPRMSYTKGYCQAQAGSLTSMSVIKTI